MDHLRTKRCRSKIANESKLEHGVIEGQQLENMYSFEYPGSRMQCDGDDSADVKYRMDIAQARFSSLHRI